MVAQILVISFIILSALGITVCVLFPQRAIPREIFWVGSAASLVICALGVEGLARSTSLSVNLWFLRGFGSLTLTLDHLSSLFLFISGIIYLSTSVFSRRYLEHYVDYFNLGLFGVVYHALWVSVVIILLAGDAVLFLIAWEAMSILAFLLVNFQAPKDENREAGYVMLGMSEAGFLAVALAFLILGSVSGGLGFEVLRAGGLKAGSGVRWGVFLLSFAGFGVKAGLFPFNRWMRDVYAAAPANVCALFSGVLLNLGIYGIVRLNVDLVPVLASGPGLIMLVIGTISALVGILYANRENDLKTMLAESSTENMGIVVAALGAGLVFTAAQIPILAGIAIITSLYHMLNHSAYKSLLFYGTGAVDTTTGTRDMDRLGGLLRIQPWIGGFFLVGVLAISAFPPFNGFVSEWLTLQTLLQSATLAPSGVKVIFALCGAVLALTAALAVTCFVKVYAMSFLGVSRSDGSVQNGRVNRSMRVAMGFLAVICLALGILPTYIISVLDRPVSGLIHTTAAGALVPPFFKAGSGELLPPAFVSEFHDLGAQTGSGFLPGPGLVVLHRGGASNPVVFAMSTSYTVVVLICLLGLTFLLVRWWGKNHGGAVRKPIWAGGLRPLQPELTYTATGFSNPVRVTFNAIFHPTEVEDSSEMVAQHFRMAIKKLILEVHLLDRIFYRPIQRMTTRVAAAFARMHHGKLNVYVAYVLLSLMAVLLLGRYL